MRAKWKKEKMVNHYSIVSKFPGLSCKRVLKKRALPFFRSVANTMEFLPKKKNKAKQENKSLKRPLTELILRHDIATLSDTYSRIVCVSVRIHGA